MQPATRRVANLAYFLTRNARRVPARAGIVWGERQWSWGELEGRVSALARGLSRRGVVKGDRVLVHAKNGNHIMEVMLACFRIGAVFVPTNFRLMPAEIVYMAEQSGASAFLCHADFPEHMAAVRAARPGLLFGWMEGGGEEGVEAWLGVEDQAPLANADVDYDDPCWFFYTSGTTGRPKAAVLTHGQMAFVLNNHLNDLMPGTTEADASVVVAPLSHGAGVHAMTQVARGAVTVLPANERLEAAEIWGLVARHRVSNMFTVPTILKLLVEHESCAGADKSSLRYVIYAGAPMYREDQKRALAALGPVLVQYFGLGEVTGNITFLPPALHVAEDGPEARVGTCGIERTGMQVEIQDIEGKPVPAGSDGEICVCGPAVFAGYWENPKANAESFRDGWFRTGDLGRMDEQGFLFITGRQSDMYISGGSNIYPREVEEKILAFPGIAECAVLGVPDPLWGEVGIAVCVPREGASVDVAGLLAFLDGKLARYKLPKHVFVQEALPKSGYGKITKALVRQDLEARGLLPLPAKVA